MSGFDEAGWEDRWVRALETHGDAVARMPAKPVLTQLAATLPPGRALDAGCGHGAEARWLAEHGWNVTAVDFSRAALAEAEAIAQEHGLADRIDWVHADLAMWTPEAEAYDLVASLYVHVGTSVEAAVRRLATGVAPGGTLLLVGHQPVDPVTGEPTAAAGQVQVSTSVALEVLRPDTWTLHTAEDRPRERGGGVDAVVVATRHR